MLTRQTLPENRTVNQYKPMNFITFSTPTDQSYSSIIIFYE